MLPSANAQIHIVQHNTIATRHIYRAQLKKLALLRQLSARSFRLSVIEPSPARLNGLIEECQTIQKLSLPLGFRFGAAKAGLKASGRADFALIVADAPASAAAVFTANRVTAAPLIVDKEHLRASGGKVRVAAINAGNANCAAGQAGLDAARATCAAVAKIFGCPPEQVFPSSTGIIGVPLPAEKIVAVLPDLAT